MTIRQRIAFSTAGVTVLMLLALSIGVYVAMSRNLHAATDNRIESVYHTYRQNPASLVVRPDNTFVVNLPELDPFTSPGLFMQVVNRGGIVNDQSASLAGQALPVPADVLAANLAGSDVFYDTIVDGADVRVYSAPVVIQGSPAVVAAVQVAESLEPINETLAQMRNILILGSLAATLVVSGAAWLLAGAVMRPLARMSATAQAIGGANDLSERLDASPGGDELERLADAFNAMLDRLEESFQAQRRFVADASHELRTPLTALGGNTEILRRMVASGTVDADSLAEGLGEIGGEVERMTRLVQDLLTLARADVGWQPELTIVDLAAIARDAARTATPLTAHHDFTAVIPEGSRMTVRGNSDQLKQLVLILLDNAVNHTPAGSTIRLDLAEHGPDIVLTVADSGPGIPLEHQQHVFERFYRTDTARTRSTGGTGLGLAIAQWIVESHSGRVTVQSTHGQGTRIEVRLPAPDRSL